MSKKSYTIALAVAGILASAAVASAQPQEPPAPPPPDAPAPPAPPADPNAPAPPPSGSAAPAAPPPASSTAAPAAPPPPGAGPAAPGAPGAQPAPEPPPPAAAPPPAPPPPAPPPPAPAVTFGASSGADTAGADADASKGPKPLAWRGTSFTWDQSATTTILGVGADYIGTEDQAYGWDFTLAPNYFLVDKPNDKVRAFAALGWNVELTNSNTTTDRREWLFKDLPVGLGYTRTVYKTKDKEYVTSAGVDGSLIFPTSKISRSTGKYVTTSLALKAKQQIKILGNAADGLNNLTAGLSFGWSHLFSRSYQPTASDPVRERQNAFGSSQPNDVLSGTDFDLNRLTLGFTTDLPLYKELTLSTVTKLTARFKHDNATRYPCAVYVANQGCVEGQHMQGTSTEDTHTTYEPLTNFDVSLSYPIKEVVTVAVGYDNENTWIGPDGKRRTMFYSPDAVFYLDITGNLDAIYSKATGRDKKTAAAKKPATAHR